MHEGVVKVPAFRSLLYREPRLYDLVFPDADETTGAMVRAAIGRYLPGVPFAAHAHGGTLLAVDALNARAYLEGHGFQERIEGRVDAPEFQATSVSLHELDRTARRLKRTRTWHIAGRADVEDYAEYRLLLPDELQRLLEGRGGSGARHVRQPGAAAH